MATTQHTAEHQFTVSSSDVLFSWGWGGEGEEIDVKLYCFVWHKIESNKNSYSENVRLRSLIAVVRRRGK